MKYHLAVVVILLFSFFLRINNINRPLLDAHYFRQTQTATVARNFYLRGIDFFHPELDIFGSGKEKVLLLEFPFYQAIVTVFSYLLGFHDYVGRLVSLIFAVSSGIILILITNKLFSDKYIGFSAMIFFIFNPLNFYFQQSYMIESTVIFLYLLSLYLWFKYTESKSNSLLISASIITSLAFIHKNIYAPFLLLPILGILYFKLNKIEFRKFHFLSAVLYSLLILFIWQYYINITNFQNGHSNFTLGDPSQQLWNFGTFGERFNVQSWLAKLKFIQNSVTKYQWPMFLIGIVFLLTQKLKNKSIVLVWLGAMVLYYLVLFRIQSHDYYFMLLTPIFSIIAAYGLIKLVKLIFSSLKLGKYQLLETLIILIYLSLFTFKSISNSKLYFRIDGNMLARLNTYNSVITQPGNILFVLPEYDWNSVYTYYTYRKGLVFAGDNLTPQLLMQYATNGYNYALIDGRSTIDLIQKNYPGIFTNYNILLSQENLLILDLTKPGSAAKI